MKKTKLFLLALLAVLTFSACGDQDNFLINNSGSNSGSTSGDNTGGNTGGNTPGESTDANNTNKNVATAEMPTVVAQNIINLEFPKVKGGTSYVSVHKLSTGETNYSSEWDNAIHASRWSCYFYTATNRNGNAKRKDIFINDPDLQALYNISEFTSSPYVSSGYDRGHMLASHERTVTQEANDQTFYFTNMQPQKHNFNGGVWGEMESYMQKMSISNTKDTIFVTKGGTIDKADNIIEYIKNSNKSATAQDGYIPVPKYFFCAVLKKTYNASSDSFNYMAFGFWFEHKDETFDSKNDKLSNYLVNIDDLESKTGIDFFCNLPDNIENDIESTSVETIKLALGMK